MNGRPVKLLGLAVVLLGSSVAAGATYTVGPGEPVGERIRQLRPGDVLLLKAGTHRGSLLIDRLVGTESAPIVIRGEPGAVLVPTDRDGILFYPGNSAHVVIEGLRIDNAPRAAIIIGSSRHIGIRQCVFGNNGVWGVQTTLSQHIAVEQCEIYGSKREHGIYFSTTDFPVARGNRIHGNNACGIHNNGDKAEGGDGMITGGLFEDNVIYDNGTRGGAAINMDGVEKTVVRNNLLYNNRAGGIISFHTDGLRTGGQNEFSHNTVHFAPGVGRYAIQIAGTSEGNAITNNILICGRGAAIELDRDALKGLRSDRNLFLRTGSTQPLELGGQRLSLTQWQTSTQQDLHSLSVDPRFANPSQGDFHLPADSPVAGLGYRYPSDDSRANPGAGISR
jgi:hypothetical protein